MILTEKAPDKTFNTKLMEHPVVRPQPKKHKRSTDENVWLLEHHVEIIQDILPFLHRNQHLAALIVV